MKTYDETFERVMAERDSYMRNRKEKIKNTAVGTFAFACVAFSVFAIVKAKGGSIPAYEKAEDKQTVLTAAATDENGDTFYYTIEDDSAYAVTIYQPETAVGNKEKADKTTAAEETTGKGFNKDGKAEDTDSLKAETAADAKADSATTTKPATTTVKTETAASMNYTYYINSGKYKNYCPGRVIEKDKVGEKTGSVTVTGYWEGFGAEVEGKTQKETLSADVYSIEGVSDDVAVCLKFNDKGDALTTNHYYVVINPDADPTPVKDYIIGAGNPPAASPGSDYTVAYTSAYAVPE